MVRYIVDVAETARIVVEAEDEEEAKRRALSVVRRDAACPQVLEVTTGAVQAVPWPKRAP